jgi:tetratricopeptide (TPR) repeat protein
MPNHIIRIWWPVTALLFLAGCAATNYYSIGKNHLEKEEYDTAIQAFETAYQNNPDDPKISREMGIAYYRKTDFGKAIPLLQKAFLKDSTDGRTLFYLGTAHEILKDYPRAMDMYRRVADVGPAEEIRSCIKARLTGLMRKQMEDEAKAVLAQESSIHPLTISDSAVAVLYFKNMGRKRELDPIQKGLADMLITDLSKVKKLKVVERVRMQKILEEAGLIQTGLVDGPSGPRAGKLLGASKLIQGSFLDLTRNGIRLDAGFVRIKPGQPIPAVKSQGTMADFFRLEKSLVLSILNKMGVTLSQAERDEIQIIPTENMLAFMAYCRGLDAEDRGQFQEARQEFQKAVDLDPKFTQAGEAVSRADDLNVSNTDVKELETQFAQSTAESRGAASAPLPAGTTAQGQAVASEAPNAGVGDPLSDQMLHAAGMLDQGFLPGIDSRKPSQEQSQPSFGNSASFEIRIPVPPGE